MLAIVCLKLFIRNRWSLSYPKSIYGINIPFYPVSVVLARESEFRTLSCFLSVHFTQNGLVYVKRLNLENATLKSKFLDQVRSLREIRNENINQMIGCYVDISSLCLVYEHCSRGSLLVSELNKCIIMYSLRNLEFRQLTAVECLDRNGIG